MKKNSFFIIFTLCYSLSVSAGGDYKTIGARAAALGYSSVSIADSWSAFNNQAGLAGLKVPTAGIYFENRFLVKELSLSAAAISVPLKKAVIAASVSHFGFELWNENKFGISAAMQFGKYFAAGVQLDYLLIKQDEQYKNQDLITFEIGILVKLSDKVSIGAHSYNPINAKISEFIDERTNATFRTGCCYKPYKKLNLLFDLHKTTLDDVFISVGAEYELISSFFIRTGISSNPSSWSFGAGINLGSFKIDMSTSRHSILGFSPQIALSYDFSKE